MVKELKSSKLDMHFDTCQYQLGD